MILKSAEVSAQQFDSNELAKINKFTLDPLKEEDVFIFKIAMCDNEIDRHFDVFTLQALNDLKNMYVGKTVIKDHSHISDNQVARIYDTDLVQHYEKFTQNNEIYTQLVARCYMLNNESNKDLISEIKAGIKKEVSIGCSVNKVKCSICGTDNIKNYCNHISGQTYENKMCYYRLEEPIDAYEVSFVAVPAQSKAGTIKEFKDKVNLSNLQSKALSIEVFMKSEKFYNEMEDYKQNEQKNERNND